MKKKLFPILMALVMGLGLSSCDHQTMASAEVTILPSQWVTSNNVNYYYATIPWEELSPEVVDYGMVNVYLIDNGAQNPLPYVYPMQYGDVVVPEQFRFDYQYGSFTIILQSLDGFLPEQMDQMPPMHFRISVLGD